MPSLDQWFLLAYTGYTVACVLALLWVAGDEHEQL